MKIYLSGEIHTDWREQIEAGCQAADLAVEFFGPVTDHDASDAAGDLQEFQQKISGATAILTSEFDSYQTLIQQADIAGSLW